MKVKDLNYIYIKDRKRVEMIFASEDLDIYVPHHVHFGALIKAIMKQIRFQIRWHKLSYKEYKVQNNINLPPKVRHEADEPRDFHLAIRASQFNLRGEDKPLEKCLIYQNEIVSALNEKGLTHCDQNILYEFRRQLIKNKIQEDYTYFNCTNIAFDLMKPKRYKDNDHCIRMIKELDEAKQFVSLDTFDYINAVDFSITLDDLQWGLRNLKIPLLQLKDCKFNTLLIEALLNHNDDSEFVLHYMEKIYEKYELPNKLRKLLPKSFYNTEFSCSHMCFNVQGFDTRLMMYDIGWFFSRFRFQDL